MDPVKQFLAEGKLLYQLQQVERLRHELKRRIATIDNPKERARAKKLLAQADRKIAKLEKKL